jgi:hypothetical protein
LSLDEPLRRHSIDVLVIDDRDVAGIQARYEALGAAIHPRDT